MDAFDADVAISYVLRAEPHNLAAPRCCFKCKLHDEPLLRTQRPAALALGVSQQAFK
jgi:hypothetical protein